MKKHILIILAISLLLFVQTSCDNTMDTKPPQKKDLTDIEVILSLMSTEQKIRQMVQSCPVLYI
jgi:hypothetical protein